jgi:hypothetical protein
VLLLLLGMGGGGGRGTVRPCFGFGGRLRLRFPKVVVVAMRRGRGLRLSLRHLLLPQPRPRRCRRLIMSQGLGCYRDRLMRAWLRMFEWSFVCSVFFRSKVVLESAVRVSCLMKSVVMGIVRVLL